MFDFSRLVETVTGAIGGQVSEKIAEILPAADLLQHAGIDLQQLEGLGSSEIMAVLESAGIDVASLTDGQLAELIGGLNSSEE
jgi:hypothetical protein